MRIGLAFSLYIFTVRSPLLFLLSPPFLQPNYFRVCPPPHTHTHTPLLHVCVEDPWKLVALSQGERTQAALVPWACLAFGFCSGMLPGTKSPWTGSLGPVVPPCLQTPETHVSLPRLGSLPSAAAADQKPGPDTPRTETDTCPAPAPAATSTHAPKGGVARALKPKVGNRLTPQTSLMHGRHEAYADRCARKKLFPF